MPWEGRDRKMEKLGSLVYVANARWPTGKGYRNKRRGRGKKKKKPAGACRRAFTLGVRGKTARRPRGGLGAGCRAFRSRLRLSWDRHREECRQYPCWARTKKRRVAWLVGRLVRRGNWVSSDVCSTNLASRDYMCQCRRGR